MSVSVLLNFLPQIYHYSQDSSLIVLSYGVTLISIMCHLHSSCQAGADARLSAEDGIET